MKKKLVALLLVVACMNMACGKQEQEEISNTVEEPAVDEAEIEETDSVEITDDERVEVFSSYIDGLLKLADTSFTMDGKCISSGLEEDINGESGILYWQYPLINDNLITTEYDSKSNCLTFKSLDVNSEKEIEVVSEITLEDFIGFSDSLDILFSEVAPDPERDLIMVESRGTAYTYADGVTYSITLIEIKEDGTLETIYEDSLSGSGDEDITSGIRSGFNEVMGQEYSKDEFEDIFYNGELFIRQEMKPIHAEITFTSDAAKLADRGDWEGASAISAKMYGTDGTDGEEVYWGEGQFIADSYK